MGALDLMEDYKVDEVEADNLQLTMEGELVLWDCGAVIQHVVILRPHTS